MASIDIKDSFSGRSKITSPPADSADWLGDVQRARLTGFARLRAIFWRRSLRLYEAWALRRRPWVRSLRKELRREFSSIDTDDASRLTQRADIFGETPILTVVKLLELAGGFGPTPDVFWDLGSGRGTTCLTAANCGFRAIGIEKEADWVRRAENIAQRLNLQASFLCADFLEADWPRNAVVFVVATAFPSELRKSICERVASLEPGSLLIAGDWTGLEQLELLWQGPLPVDWGAIPFSLYRVGETAI
jgi:SAM-dependent methyltransferase